MKKKSIHDYVTCARCMKSKLLQYYDGNINDPLIAECRSERFVAKYHTCQEAEASKGIKPVTRINKKLRTA